MLVVDHDPQRLVPPSDAQDHLAVGANRFRFGPDDSGHAYIGSTLAPGAYVSDSVEALRALISAVGAGAADHLL